MVYFRPIILFVLLSLVAACYSDQVVREPRPADAPATMLWAWERNEDLRFIDPATTGVAFLAMTLTLEADSVRREPRRQPLSVPDGTHLTAVIRIETVKQTERRPALSDGQIAEIVELARSALERPNTRGIQIDFDAALSARPFYRKLMKELRSGLPAGTPLTMTALASWCVGDSWLQEMDVDEAVPMAFVMGADAERIRSFLRAGNDWTEPLCRASYGLSIDEAPLAGLKPGRRVYYFSDDSWNAGDLKKLYYP